MNESVRIIGGKTLAGENHEVLTEKPIPVLLCPPQRLGHVSMVWGQQPTACPAQQPSCPLLYVTVWKQSYAYREHKQLLFGSHRVPKRMHEHVLFPLKVLTILLISIQHKQQEFSKLLNYKSLENTERPGSAQTDYLQRSKWGRSHIVTCPVSVKLLCIWQNILL
jgi:hypothetical protein